MLWYLLLLASFHILRVAGRITHWKRPSTLCADLHKVIAKNVQGAQNRNNPFLSLPFFWGWGRVDGRDWSCGGGRKHISKEETIKLGWGGENDIQECSHYLVKMCPKRDFKNAGDAMIKRLRKDSKALKVPLPVWQCKELHAHPRPSLSGLIQSRDFRHSLPRWPNVFSSLDSRLNYQLPIGWLQLGI